MECPPPQAWAADQLSTVYRRALDERLPLMAAFDLTYRCNLRCVHCYAGHRVAENLTDATELSTSEVVRLLEETAAAGTLHLTLSGGEPLLRPDFAEIYVRARTLGMVVSVFTNATLVSGSHLDLFGEYVPYQVDVSVYGATEETYERVSGVPGSFKRALRGIELLLDRGVRVTLKTVILRDNAGDVDAMEDLASRLGVSFRLDPLVMPRLDGDLSPLEQRVEAEHAVELELGDEERRTALRDWVEQQQPTPVSRRLFHCGAGRMSYHLDPHGSMTPCVVSRDPAFSAVSLGVNAAWQRLAAAVDRLEIEAETLCATCALVVVCGYCPTLFSLESGSASRQSEYVCKLGAARAAGIGLDMKGLK